MVGFPGETDEEFNETYQVVEDVAFSKIHVFQYSPREGTPAARFKAQVPSQIKAARSDKLIELGTRLEQEFMDKFIGTEEKVLFEQLIPGSSNIYEGYTENYIKVAAESSHDIQNEIISVVLERMEDDILLGKIR